MPGHGTSESEDEGWWRGLTLNASYSHWLFRPIDTKSTTSDGQDWSQVGTEEHYDLEGIGMYHVSAVVKTRYLDFKVGYESNRGIVVGDDFGPSDVIDIVARLTGIPVLSKLTLELKTLSFHNGIARLDTRVSGTTIDAAVFDFDYAFAELRYNGFDTKAANYLFARFASYALPRNVYLEEQVGEGDSAHSVYYPISNRLLRVETDLYQVGVGMSSERPLDGGGLAFLYRLGIGMGPYALRSLVDRQLVAERAWLLGFLAGVEVDYRIRIGEQVFIGIKDALDVQFLEPLGLPADIEREIEATTDNIEDYSFSFGTVDLLNSAYAYLSIGW